MSSALWTIFRVTIVKRVFLEVSGWIQHRCQRVRTPVTLKRSHSNEYPREMLNPPFIPPAMG